MGLQTKAKNKDKTAQAKDSPVKVVEPMATDDGEGPATPAAVSTDKPRKKRDPAKVRIVKAFEKTAERLGKLSAAFGHFDARESTDETPNLAKMLASADEWFGAALSYARSLPDDFKAPRKSRGPNAPRAVLAVAKGDVVSIKPTAIKSYLADDEKELPGGNKVTVVALIGDKKTKCKFGDGTFYAVSRSHLCELIK